jgi:hypothetical protein
MTVLNFQISADSLLCAGKEDFKTGRGECSHAQFYWSQRRSKASEGMPLKRGIVDLGASKGKTEKQRRQMMSKKMKKDCRIKRKMQTTGCQELAEVKLKASSSGSSTFFYLCRGEDWLHVRGAARDW